MAFLGEFGSEMEGKTGRSPKRLDGDRFVAPMPIGTPRDDMEI